jgi:hypothetical protein
MGKAGFLAVERERTFRGFSNLSEISRELGIIPRQNEEWVFDKNNI